MGSAIKRIADIAMTVVLVAVLGLFIGWFAVPRVMGLTPQRVLTGSMEPKLPVGGVAFVHAVLPADVHVGDIITFRDPVPEAKGALVTHRVVGITSDSAGNPAFRTKGDANEVADPWVIPSSLLVGRVKYVIPYAGQWTTKARSPLGFLLIIGLPALYIASGEIRNIVVEVKGHRARKRLAIQDPS